MIKDLTITKIYRSEKDKQGNLFIGKSGKPYTKISIKTKEYGDRWIGGFGNRDNVNWKEGDVVSLDIVENGQWLNFERIDEIKIVKQELKKINEKLDKLILTIDPLATFETLKTDKPENINVEDIPF